MNYAILLLGFVVLLKPAVTKTQTRQKRFITLDRCYGELGCFSTGGDFYDITKRPIQLLPLSRETINVRYFLFTRQNMDQKQELKLHNTDLLHQSFFNGKKKTFIITHGFMSNGEKDWITAMRKTFLIKSDCNVVQMDWKRGAFLPYTQATANTRLVGAEAALLIKFLEENTEARREDMHFLGHSLGAHVGGYAGEKLDGKLGRITALDPAGPYFENTKPVVRLDPSDALFVDAIHTDGNSIFNQAKLDGGCGLLQPVGHVDFYPNGGQIQTGCSRNPINHILEKGLLEGMKWTVACDHRRVNPLFIESILSEECKFTAYPCDSYENFKSGKCTSCGEVGCARMGYHADKWTGRQQFKEVKMYLDTTGSTEPFCVHPYFIQIDIGNGDKESKVNGNMFITLHGDLGSSSEFNFFEKKGAITPNTSYKKAFFVKNNLGDLKKVSFRWQYSRSISDPGGLIFNRYIHLKEITVVNGTVEKTSKYCGQMEALKSGTDKIINKSLITNSC